MTIPEMRALGIATHCLDVVLTFTKNATFEEFQDAFLHRGENQHLAYLTEKFNLMREHPVRWWCTLDEERKTMIVRASLARHDRQRAELERKYGGPPNRA